MVAAVDSRKLFDVRAVWVPPPVLKGLCARPAVMLGHWSTGSGKTTTLATMIDYINETSIITLSRLKTRSRYHTHKKSDGEPA